MGGITPQEIGRPQRKALDDSSLRFSGLLRCEGLGERGCVGADGADETSALPVRTWWLGGGSNKKNMIGLRRPVGLIGPLTTDDGAVWGMVLIFLTGLQDLEREED